MDGKVKDKIRGSLIGGAAGDALGFVVEFYSEREIFSTFGKDGISEFRLKPPCDKALISDDTQMTLFTANGVLSGLTESYLHGSKTAPHLSIERAYQDWLYTQFCARDRAVAPNNSCTWLSEVLDLYSSRAPGGTCLSALEERRQVDDYISEPVNRSKGCGGIMRVAPVALAFNTGNNLSIIDLDKEGAYAAAVTHGHPLGYMPAAVVTHIINRLVYGSQDFKNTSGNYLKNIVLEARDTCAEIFAGFDYLDELIDIIDRAVILSENDDSDIDNIHKLGEGWVAEETLGIALYCALKYQNDFSKALTVAVNHKGDSDSTGAVTGNILGALTGYDVIDDKWKNNLELHDVIIEIADDLAVAGCALDGEFCKDVNWQIKYVNNHRIA